MILEEIEEFKAFKGIRKWRHAKFYNFFSPLPSLLTFTLQSTIFKGELIVIIQSY